MSTPVDVGALEAAAGQAAVISAFTYPLFNGAWSQTGDKDAPDGAGVQSGAQTTDLPASLSAEIPQPPLSSRPASVDSGITIDAGLVLRQLMFAANEVMSEIDAADPGGRDELQADLSQLLTSAATLSELIAKPASMEMLNAALVGAARALADEQDDDLSLADGPAVSGKAKRALSPQRAEMARVLREAILRSPMSQPELANAESPTLAAPEPAAPDASPLPPEVHSYISEGVQKAEMAAMTGAVLAAATAYAANEADMQRPSQDAVQTVGQDNLSQAAIHQAMVSVAFNALSPEHQLLLGALVPEAAAGAPDGQNVPLTPNAAQQLQEILAFAQNNMLSPEAVTRAFDMRAALASGSAPAGMTPEMIQEQQISASSVLALAAFNQNVSTVARTIIQRAAAQEATAVPAAVPSAQQEASPAVQQPQVVVMQAHENGTISPASKVEYVQQQA